MFFNGQILLNTILLKGGGACITEAFDGENGYGRISGGRRVLEQVVASRKASPRKGAR
jgi:hypothetical protein